MGKKMKLMLISMGIAAGIALCCLYLSGISLFTLIIGARTVEVRDDMSKGNMQTLTGEVLGSFMADESGTYTAISCDDGVITVLFDEKQTAGETVTANGFVSVLDDGERENLFAWYEDNGDFSGGTEYFDNVSPLMIHDNHGRFFDTGTSTALSGVCIICGIYMMIIYMGIRSGKYGE